MAGGQEIKMENKKRVQREQKIILIACVMEIVII